MRVLTKQSGAIADVRSFFAKSYTSSSIYLQIHTSDKFRLVTSKVTARIGYILRRTSSSHRYRRDECCPVLFCVGLAEEEMGPAISSQQAQLLEVK